MAKQPNYGQERAERQRRKAARRDERLAAKAERRDRSLPPGPASVAAPETQLHPAVAKLGAFTPEDPVTLIRLGQVLRFVCGGDHPATLAVQRAAASGVGEDIDRARVLFLRLTPGNQHAALTIAAAAPSALR